MELGTIIDDAFTYTKEGVLCNIGRWLKLMLAFILLGIPFNGYVMRIYRGAHPAPEADNWGILFIDGLKLIVVSLLYAIPVIILWVLAYSGFILTAASGDFGRINDMIMSGWSPNIGLIIAIYILEILLAVLLPVACIRFARTNSFSEAFNLGGITAHIGRIGWLNYLLALVVVGVIIGIPVAILIFGIIIFGVLSGSLIGMILAAIAIMLVIIPLAGVFQARCMTQVYDSIPKDA